MPAWQVLKKLKRNPAHQLRLLGYFANTAGGHTCQVLLDPVDTVAAEAVTAWQHQWHSVCAVVVFIADLTADRHMQLRLKLWQQAHSAGVAYNVGGVIRQYDWELLGLKYHLLTRAVSRRYNTAALPAV